MFKVMYKCAEGRRGFGLEVTCSCEPDVDPGKQARCSVEGACTLSC